MSDKRFDGAPDGATSDVEKSLYDSAYESLMSGAEALVSYFGDGAQGQDLQAKGTIPALAIDAGVAVKAGSDVLPDEMMCVDDQGEGALSEPLDPGANADGFLSRHPVFNASKKLESDYKEALADQKALDARLSVLDAASKKVAALEDDLLSDGVDPADPETFVGKLAALPAEKRAEYQRRFDEIQPHVRDLERYDEIAREASLSERRLHRLEKSASFSEDLKAIDSLPAAERNEIYRSLELILDSENPMEISGLDSGQRQELVRDIVHQIAHPEDIKQGNKDTCALASSEFVVASDHPAVYARAVAEWATAGELTSLGDQCVEPGSGVRIDIASIHADDGNPARSFASKIFQTGAANAALLNDGARYENYKPGAVPENRQVKGVTPVDDTGERIVYVKDGKEVAGKWPGLDADNQVEVLSLITGDNYEAEKLYPANPDMLHEMLLAEAGENGWPIKVGFLLPDNSGHAVTITGIETGSDGPVVVYEDTAARRGKPQELPLADFYKLSMKGPSMFYAGGHKFQMLTAGPNSNPYVQIIHR